MSRKFVAPLQNITNTSRFTGKVSRPQKHDLSETERNVLKAHRMSDENEICSMTKYSKNIGLYYEGLDIEHTFVENAVSFEMRSLLIDWLISCHMKINLTDDTLHLSIYLTDRFLSNRAISSSKLQLVGITALFIAAKYEEVVCPDLNSFILLAEKNYTDVEIKKAEKFMLFSLNYEIKYVNPLFFLRRVSKANNYERKTRKMAKYFLELMTLYKDFYSFKKSVLGTTAMYLARKICQTDINKNIFFMYANLERSEIKECFDKLVNLINNEPEYTNIETKYSISGMNQVNMIARAFAKNYFN